jgi:predicted GH43/DUF377 family glycosyl hydrolase
VDPVQGEASIVDRNREERFVTFAGMKWNKRGRILIEGGEHPSMVTHAAVPIAEPAAGGLWRVYFSSRDREQRSHTGCALVDLFGDVPRVVSVGPSPILSPGRLGAFDDSGAMGSWIVRSEERTYLYYIGWNRGITVPFRNAIGLAVSEDGGRSFVRYSEGPILDRDTYDPFFTASSCVLIEGALWRMWYLSCVGWEFKDAKPQHRYQIKYAESRDGIHWDKTGVVAVGFKSSDEYAISRPCVVKDGNVYRMWYSYRGMAYRIGYAESADGITWRRLDESVGIGPGPEPWDSEMIEYPFVFDAGLDRCMLYNGNDYGRTGIGVAVLDRA